MSKKTLEKTILSDYKEIKHLWQDVTQSGDGGDLFKYENYEMIPLS